MKLSKYLILLFLLFNINCLASTTTDHDYKASARLRYGFLEEGQESGKTASLASQLMIHSQWKPFLATEIEVGNVITALDDQYNDGREISSSPNIPDVASTELKQLSIELTDGVNSTLIGRQRIELDNQRFIGSNKFWQNDQTFDAVKYQRNFFTASKFRYYSIIKANRIFSTNGQLDERTGYQQLGQHYHRSHLLHFLLRDLDYQDISFFYYNIRNLSISDQDNHTLGANYKYEKRLGTTKPSAEITVARQSREIQGKTSQLPYYRLQLSLAGPSKSASVRYEVLSSRNKINVITPLADLHAFQGWADVFNNQSHYGIRDASLKLLWRSRYTSLDVRRHWFYKDIDGRFLGSEWDMDITVKINRSNRILLRLAQYSATEESQRLNIPNQMRFLLNYQWKFNDTI